MMNEGILAVNPGSTSTKIALYNGDIEILNRTLLHSREELAPYPAIQDQLPLRLKAVKQFIRDESFHPIHIVVARGGILPPVEAGAYRVDRRMANYLASGKAPEHASNLAAQIALEIAEEQADCMAIVYDGVSTDQLAPLSRYSGSALLTRESNSHCLNMRAVCFAAAKELGRNYKEVNLIAAHLGGGISLSLHSGGRMVDIVSDDEGPMSPERAGKLPCRNLVNLCYSGRYSRTEMQRNIRGRGGLMSYLGTTDIPEIQERIAGGDEKAREVLEAMALQIAKAVGELSVVTGGKIDMIILTGGLAHSPLIVPWIKERVEFIAPVKVIPGEFEMEALAAGALRVLRGEESVQQLEL